MTLDQFFDALAVRAPRLHWKLSGELRHLRGYTSEARAQWLENRLCCPITALVSGPKDPFGWRVAARTLGLDMADAEAIMYAADNGMGHDRALRARLLAACGVEEGSP